MESGEIGILLIDDDPTDIEITLDALRTGLQASARIARGGQEALDYLLGRGHFGNRRRNPLPDLILLDLHMPAVDGYAVLRGLRQAEAIRRIPVIVLCMSEPEGARVMRSNPWPDDFLVKPITPECLRGLPQQFRNWTLRLDLPEPYRDALR